MMKPEHKEEVFRQRREGATWDQIAKSRGVSRFAVITFAKRHGIWTPTKPAAPPPPLLGHRMPLEAGHPETWGAITRGTLLHGTPYIYEAPI